MFLDQASGEKNYQFFLKEYQDFVDKFPDKIFTIILTNIKYYYAAKKAYDISYTPDDRMIFKGLIFSYIAERLIKELIDNNPNRINYSPSPNIDDDYHYVLLYV